MINTKSLLQKTDLASLVESSLRVQGKPSGRWIFWQCPFHSGDETPSLGVNREQGRWFCFACRNRGDAITWVMKFQGLTFKNACEYIAGGEAKNLTNSDVYRISKGGQQQRRPDELQTAWVEIIKTCEELLWQSVGRKAREYLAGRGLNDSILKSPFFRVGYSPGIKISDVWVERGIVIPCFTTKKNLEIEYVSYIKVRRPSGTPKYRKLPGLGAKLSGLYGAEWTLGADVVFITEGEFDALLLLQEARDLVGVCTLGGASDRLDFATHGKYLLAAKHIFVAYDTDQAGQRATEDWKELSSRVITAQVPTGKDITEYWLAGGNLSDWVMATLKTYGIE